MKRKDLEHVIREVGRRTGLDYFYIIGSAAALASLPASQEEALVGTRDVDVIPSPPDPSKIQDYADKLDAWLGEGSPFDAQHGYYVQGVDFTTPTYAPTGWCERAIPVRVGGFTGLCMELHDLALSKYGAGREKDLEFTAALAKTGAIRQVLLEERLSAVTAPEALLGLMRARIQADFSPAVANQTPLRLTTPKFPTTR